MAKSYKKQRRDLNDYWDEEQETQYKSSNVDRRKEKRVRAALRTKDINSLMRYNEDY